MADQLILSALDQAPIPQGSTGGQAMANSIDLAKLCDDLGYHRYWYAEHHATKTLACAAPEVLIAATGMATRRIRLGSGGIMLPHYSPFKVAEVFSMLAGLNPGRIDLGVGRAPGSDQITAWALQRDRNQAAPDDFPQQLSEMLAYIEEGVPEDHPFHRIGGLPGLPERPAPWLLGSSGQSGVWAAQFSLPYAFADFIGGDGTRICQYYRDHFVPTPGRLDAPYTMVAVRAICAETDEEALRRGASTQLQLILRVRGRPMTGVIPMDVAIKQLEQEGIPLGALPRGRKVLCGSPGTIREQIEQVAADYQADEVMVLTITHDHQHRRDSYRLIAEEFGLATPTSATLDM